MQVTRFDIDGPLLVVPQKHGDQRGFFSEMVGFKQVGNA
jgi:dTDP-4-dehydrorhamnose 3,5-epimerase-like enzyme